MKSARLHLHSSLSLSSRVRLHSKSFNFHSNDQSINPTQTPLVRSELHHSGQFDFRTIYFIKPHALTIPRFFQHTALFTIYHRSNIAKHIAARAYRTRNISNSHSELADNRQWQRRRYKWAKPGLRGRRYRNLIDLSHKNQHWVGAEPPDRYDSPYSGQIGYDYLYTTPCTYDKIT